MPVRELRCADRERLLELLHDAERVEAGAELSDLADVDDGIGRSPFPAG